MATIREMREKQGMITPEQFAARVGISVSTVMRLDRGARVSRNTALRIAKVLGKDLAELPLDYPGKRSGEENAQ